MPLEQGQVEHNTEYSKAMKKDIDWILNSQKAPHTSSRWDEITDCALTHWGQMMHICVGKQNIIDSGNGLSPGRHQAIIWTNAGILLIGPLGTNFSEILIEILKFSFTKMRLKVLSAKWRPFCLSLNVLKVLYCIWEHIVW